MQTATIWRETINQSLTSRNQTSVLLQSRKQRKQRSLDKKLNKSRTKKTPKHLPLETLNNTTVADKSRNSHQSISIIEISPEKKQSIRNRNENSNSHSESDCEIIEQVTPLIVLDDDFINESSEQSARPNIQNETSETIKSTVNSIDASDINGTVIVVPNQTPNKNNSLSSNEVTTESNLQPPEEIPWFFEDKTPGCTDSEAPIYEINCASSTNNYQNMAKKIQITFQNKENNVNFDNSFAPNPLLSSTHLNGSCDEMEASPENLSNDTCAPSQANNLCITINSTGVNDISRQVSIGKTSPIASETAKSQMINASLENAQKMNKRKASNEIEKNEPALKRSRNEPSDVIVVNDTISDEDDSVVFVSETLDHQNRNRINLLRAKNFISLSGDNSNRNGSKSTRAKRKKERKREKNRVIQANISNKILEQRKNRINRFDPNRLNNSVNTATASSSSTSSSSTSGTAIATTTSATAAEKAVAKKKIILEYEKEKKMFAEKPELFEKRVIIIDGSNVAFSHGEAIGKKGLYSVKGLELCMKYFENRGHIVRIVIPSNRINRSSDPLALQRMDKHTKLIKSPCKNLPDQRSTSYDDRFVLQAAKLMKGAIISNDNYADLLNEDDEWNEIIKQRVVGFSWLDDFIMIPDDPYGRNGRTLQLILHKLKNDANIDDINKNGDSKSQ
ncbi:NEDD4-binding protein 1-like [Contarinia nasturtii]|uniref:NEDD4-binding protein 1-like n=1 Tax=Contarinia nasturtii TaxID=265458 RepID=UPI0012D3C7B9|nr:NEDD4-binding protein 1-like [Contarinia nasturtii]